MLNVGHKRAPYHAEEADKDHLVSGGYKGKVHRLHDGPVDNTHFVRVKKFLLQLKRIIITTISTSSLHS